MSYRKVADLRYGENPHQKAAFYAGADAAELCMARAKLLGGKEISYNNYFDANGALDLVKEFASRRGDHQARQPSGYALDGDLVEAYRKAYLGDVNAAMGGILAVNRPVTAPLASAIVESYKRWGKAAGAMGFFAEMIVAPSFEAGALQTIRAREGWGKEVRLMETGPLTSGEQNREKYLRYVVGGLIVQDRDLLGVNERMEGRHQAPADRAGNAGPAVRPGRMQTRQKQRHRPGQGPARCSARAGQMGRVNCATCRHAGQAVRRGRRCGHGPGLRAGFRRLLPLPRQPRLGRGGRRQGRHRTRWRKEGRRRDRH